MKIFYKSFLIFMLTGAALFSATSCGSAPPVVISDGSRFPLIDIVDAKISIADTNWKEAIPWSHNPGTVIIGGTLGKEIHPKDLTINLIATDIKIPIDVRDNLSSWFLNMPAGMTATVTKGVDPDNSKDKHNVITMRI